jgi:hypothetical protein
MTFKINIPDAQDLKSSTSPFAAGWTVASPASYRRVPAILFATLYSVVPEVT